FYYAVICFFSICFKTSANNAHTNKHEPAIIKEVVCVPVFATMVCDNRLKINPPNPHAYIKTP
ncbi:MAG TPA: hypothetical protein P5243_05585, partial [Bacteroidales bacterium]|nr:hypothetical protein [Bacteroidales bacterium]